jgi:hypothetical protein
MVVRAMAKYPRINRKLFEIVKFDLPDRPYVVYFYDNNERDVYYCNRFNTKKEARNHIVRIRKGMREEKI